MLPWVAELNALNPFVAFELDACVATFAVIIKNALHETVEQTMGSTTKHVSKYKLEELLNPDFQFGANGHDSPLPVGDGAGYDEVR